MASGYNSPRWRRIARPTRSTPRLAGTMGVGASFRSPRTGCKECEAVQGGVCRASQPTGISRGRGGEGRVSTGRVPPNAREHGADGHVALVP